SYAEWQGLEGLGFAGPALESEVDGQVSGFFPVKQFAGAIIVEHQTESIPDEDFELALHAEILGRETVLPGDFPKPGERSLVDKVEEQVDAGDVLGTPPRPYHADRVFRDMIRLGEIEHVPHLEQLPVIGQCVQGFPSQLQGRGEYQGLECRSELPAGLIDAIVARVLEPSHI